MGVLVYNNNDNEIYNYYKDYKLMFIYLRFNDEIAPFGVENHLIDNFRCVSPQSPGDRGSHPPTEKLGEVLHQNAFIYSPYSGIQRTGGLAWIWRQPPKLQAEGSNPSLFAILFYSAVLDSTSSIVNPKKLS